MRHGRCPRDERDDLLPRPFDVEVVTRVGHMDPSLLRGKALLLRFPTPTSYESVRISRAVSEDGPFAVIDDVDLTGPLELPYYDEDLLTGARYFYQFQGVGANGAESDLSPIVSRVARLQPIPPAGSFLLNNGTTRTDSLSVRFWVDDTAQANGSEAVSYRLWNVGEDAGSYIPLPGSRGAPEQAPLPQTSSSACRSVGRSARSEGCSSSTVPSQVGTPTK